MKVNRTNYEIWFIDWLDGNLNSPQIEQLNLFLKDNPDLKEEFSELTSVGLSDSDSHYRNKEALKKTAKEIPDSQFEYLCVAFLENDLSSDQKNEILEIIERDSEKKNTFELIQKTRISPLSVTYNHKSYLLKRTPVQKIIWLSAIGLSAAAAITLIITIFLNPPKEISVSSVNTASIVIPEKIIQRKETQEPETISLPARKERIFFAKREQPVAIPADTLEKRINVQIAGVNKINFMSDISFTDINTSNTLIAANISSPVTVEDDGRSNISRFISKTFREKILREKTAPDSPLKGYEIAEAGVTGLNKLLGWEMELDKNNDENGDLSSVNFSSKLLKFNTPVKKSEPEP